METRRRVAEPPDVLGRDLDLGVLDRQRSGQRLRCRTCGHIVTSDEHRIEIEGHHVLSGYPSLHCGYSM